MANFYVEKSASQQCQVNLGGKTAHKYFSVIIRYANTTFRVGERTQVDIIHCVML